MIVLLPLLVGGSGPAAEPNEPNIEACPFPVDPNWVEGKLLGWLVVDAGRTVTHTRTWHDPDGDEAYVQIVKGPRGARVINRPRAGSYTILWTPQQPGTFPLVLRITDNPPTGRPQNATGTLLIHVPSQRRATRSPCGGQPR